MRMDIVTGAPRKAITDTSASLARTHDATGSTAGFTSTFPTLPLGSNTIAASTDDASLPFRHDFNPGAAALRAVRASCSGDVFASALVVSAGADGGDCASVPE